jgi:beta-lactamase regulating signal transducer with metallopeptidase domain
MNAAATFLSEQTVRQIGWVLVHFLWQGLTAAVIMWAVLKTLGRTSANVRYLAACVGLILMAAAPAVTFVVIGPEKTVPSMQRAGVETPAVRAAEPVAEPVVIMMDAPVPTERSLKAIMVEKLEAALPYCVVVWIAGVAGLSLWYLGGWCQLQKLRLIGIQAAGERIAAETAELAQRLGIKRMVRIAESMLVQVPTVIGWLQPVILLPAAALTGLDEIQLRAMIAHELAHIKRSDYLVNIAQTVIEILGFYHPAVWWMSRQIRIERENCCDDIAAELIQDRTEYAKALFSMEEIRVQQFTPALRANGGSLIDRIGRLVGKTGTENQRSGWVPLAVVSMVVAALFVSVRIAAKPGMAKEPGEEVLRQTIAEETGSTSKKTDAGSDTQQEQKESMNRLKQLGLAYFMFLEDHKGLLAFLENLQPYLDEETYSWLGENAVMFLGDAYSEEQSVSYRPLAYDKTFLQKYGRRIVVFMDGHVEIDSNDGLKETLDKAIRFSNMSRLKHLGLELWMWADRNNGILPETLEQIEFQQSALKEWAVNNVTYPAGGRVIADIKKPAEEIMAYDQSLLKTQDGTTLLYVDGHVEYHSMDELPNLLPQEFPKAKDGGMGGGTGSGDSTQLPKIRKEIKTKQGIQIAIEARFILVNDDFLQEIGAERLEHGMGQVIEGFANSNEIAAALEAKAINERISPFDNFPMLDDLQQTYLLRAVQKQKTAKTLTAPKAVVLNNESASIQVKATCRYLDIDDIEKDLDTGITLDILPELQNDNEEILLKAYMQITNRLENRIQMRNGKEYEIPYLQVTEVSVHTLVNNGKMILIVGPELTVKSEESDGITAKQRLLILLKSTVAQAEEIAPMP